MTGSNWRSMDWLKPPRVAFRIHAETGCRRRFVRSIPAIAARIACGLALICLGWSVLPLPAGAAAPRHAVILFSYRQGWWAVEDEDRGIRRGLADMGYAEGRNLTVSRLYMNTKTVNKTAAQMEAAAGPLLDQIRALNPDILFIMDDDALRHVGAKLLDASLPIVFGGINLVVTDPDYGWGENGRRTALADSIDVPGHNITGVLERLAIGAGFNLLHEMLPEARTALFMSDNSVLSNQLFRAAGARAALENLPITIVRQEFTDDYETLKRLVRDYQDRVDCIVMLLPWTFVDRQGRHVPQERVVRWLLQNNRRPGVAYLDVLAEEGFLCGVVVDMVQQGVHAGVIGGRILNGAHPSTIPIVDPVANRIMINMARANQLGIDIPFEVLKRSDQVFKQMSAYPEYGQRD